MLVFFGDPESRGAAEDAAACLRMAVDMQRRVIELNAEWHRRGIDDPFGVRMGVNTGYCDVGNFGSNDRMDYTIIGAEANLAARLQGIAAPGQVVLSYETYALVRGIAEARALPPIRVKGIVREIVPFALEQLRDSTGGRASVLETHVRGADVYIDPTLVDPASAPQVRHVLAAAMVALEKRASVGGRGATSGPLPSAWW
jgi:class 3 adenylate cyclase